MNCTHRKQFLFSSFITALKNFPFLNNTIFIKELAKLIFLSEKHLKEYTIVTNFDVPIKLKKITQNYRDF